MQETWVQSLGREDSLEEGMATHSIILAWKIPWTEPARVQPTGLQSQIGLSDLAGTHTRIQEFRKYLFHKQMDKVIKLWPRKLD